MSSWKASLALWSFTWGVLITMMAVAVIQEAWTVAVWLAVIQWAPAIWVGQAWDQVQ